MFCPRCGTNMRDDAAFCPSCGAMVQSSTPPPPGVPVVQPAYIQQETDGKAVASLVLGILTFFFSLLAGIPAIILGHMSRSEIRKSAGRLKGEGMALTGLILGYLSLVWIPVIFIILAIAIPNLQRARGAANEAAAMAMVRSVNVAEITYSTNYPDAGYVPLAALGSGADNCPAAPSRESACLVDNQLGCPNGRSGRWCTKDSYRFSIVITAHDYVITATPENSQMGRRSFCSTADSVVRVRYGSRLWQPIQTAEECQTWDAM